MLGLLAQLCTAVAAQETRILSQEEMKPLTDGKQWVQRSRIEGSIARWEVKANGDLFANYKGVPPQNPFVTFVERGTWSIRDDGRFCIEWRTTKWRPSLRECFAIAETKGELTMMTDANPAQVHATLTVE